MRDYSRELPEGQGVCTKVRITQLARINPEP